VAQNAGVRLVVRWFGGSLCSLSGLKYKLDRPLTQALAELPHQWGLLANAFVDDNPFYAEHE
jgi:hypothetical protein